MNRTTLLMLLALLPPLACGEPEPQTYTCGEVEVEACVTCDEAPLLCGWRERCVADCATSCPGTTDCGVFECVDLTTDGDHCGGCNRPCSRNEACIQASCQCEEGYADCDDDPSNGCGTNILEDDDNCGACGLDCGDGYDCCDGRCRYILGDPQRCGSCTTRCSSDEICANGVCEDRL